MIPSLFKRLPSFLILAALSPACVFSMDENDSDDWNIDDGKPTYDAVNLKLIAGEYPLFYEASSSPIRLSLEDGTVISGEPFCNCTTECPVGAAYLPAAAAIPAGQAAERTWDGSYWAPKAGQQNCYEKRYYPKGTKIVANFCAASHHFLSQPGALPFIDPVSSQDITKCEAETFTLGETTQVDHTMNVNRFTTPLKVIFKNSSRFKLLLKNDCTNPRASWLKVTQDPSYFAAYTLITDNTCGANLCGQDAPDPCPALDIACAEFTEVEAESGVEFAWDGWALIPQAAGQCLVYQPTPVGPVELEVCYRRESIVSPTEMDLKCITKSVLLGMDATVTLEADPML